MHYLFGLAFFGNDKLNFLFNRFAAMYFEYCKTETFFIYNSQIGGSIPSELGRLDLTEFLSNNNRLRSTIPEEFWNNERLTLFRLDSNEIEGSISSNIGNLVDLTDLFLYNNTLTGTLPVTMLRLTSLGLFESVKNHELN